ncbi:MAG: hypothetical protein MH825_12470 [Cyanobacteria bacterium]|nr:hypothetical protein [Cyanobacteriota bacterium]
MSLKDLVHNIRNAADLNYLLTSSEQLEDGDRIALCLSLASQSPEVALGAFAEILKSYKNGDWRLRALALQGLAQLGCMNTLKEMRDCQSKDASAVLQLFKGELDNSRAGSELTQWSAAMAMNLIGYSSHSLNLASIPRAPEAYMRQIEEKMLGRQQYVRRLDPLGRRTVDYEDYLNFWIFGPTQRLFQARNPERQDIEEVLDRLSGYGVVQAFKTDDANEVTQRKIVFPRLVSMAKNYLSDPLDYLQSTYFECFLKLDSVSRENANKLAQILTFQYPINDINSLKDKTMEDLGLSIDKSNRQMSDLKDAKNIIRSLSEFHRVEKFCIENYDQYLEREKAWQLAIEKRMQDLLRLDVLLGYNYSLLLGTVASVESSEYDEIKSVKIRSISSGKLVGRKTHTTLLREYEHLKKIKDELQRDLEKISHANFDVIRTTESEISDLSEAGKMFAKWSIYFLLIVVFAEVIVLIVGLIIFVVMLLISAAMSGGGSGG